MPERHAYTIRNKRLENGQWVDLTGVEVPLENGTGISQYHELLVVDEDRLYNPATGDVLNRTRKSKEAGNNKNYFSKETGVLVNVYHVGEVDGS